MTNSPQLKVQLAQIDVTPGQPAKNLEKMLRWIEEAKRDKADMIVFPEMAIPGYLLGDLWEQEAFLRDCEAAGNAIKAAATTVTVIFGNVGVDWARKNEDGRVRKYNALFVAEGQTFLSSDPDGLPFVTKTLLPNYREFDDSRHFFDTRKRALELGCPIDTLLRPVRSNCGALACMLCEDAWDSDYCVSPMSILASQAPDLFVNISCSPFTMGKNAKRHRVFSDHAKTSHCPLLYVNNVGSQNNGKTTYVFDGSSCVYDSHGTADTTPASFEESRHPVTVKLTRDAVYPSSLHPADDIESVYKALRSGIEHFLAQTGIRKIVIGLSGGIDSAVAAALYGSILPPSDLLLVNMPSPFNSSTTISIAEGLADNLNCYYTSIPLSDSVSLTKQQIDGLQIQRRDGADAQTLALSDLALQNIQARDRSSRILAALASAFGGAFTCNANKAEATVGYTTLYGDLAGCLAALGDLWKQDIYALGHYLNNTLFEKAIIPENCFAIVPSAELAESQDVDSGQGDPMHYPYHDLLFHSWVERWNRATPEDTLRLYTEGKLEKDLNWNGKIESLFPTADAFVQDLEKWWGCYQGLGVAKRIQAPPVIAVTRRAFGFDHREAQLGAYYTTAYTTLKNDLLTR